MAAARYWRAARYGIRPGDDYYYKSPTEDKYNFLGKVLPERDNNGQFRFQIEPPDMPDSVRDGNGLFTRRSATRDVGISTGGKSRRRRKTRKTRKTRKSKRRRRY